MVLKAGMKYILTMGYTGLDWLNLYEIFKEEEQELVGIICAFNPQLRLLKREMEGNYNSRSREMEFLTIKPIIHTVST